MAATQPGRAHSCQGGTQQAESLWQRETVGDGWWMNINSQDVKGRGDSVVSQTPLSTCTERFAYMHTEARQHHFPTESSAALLSFIYSASLDSF